MEETIGNRIITLLLALILIFSFMISLQSASADHAEGDPSSIISEIILEKQNYSAGDTVNWTCRMFNSGTDWVNLTWDNMNCVYQYGYVFYLSSQFWEETQFTEPYTKLPALYEMDFPPLEDLRITPYEKLSCSDLDAGYYRVWIAFNSFDNLNAWSYFTVDSHRKEISADFFSSIYSDGTTFQLHANASASRNLYNDSGALEFRWDWEADSVWDINWTTNLETHHNFDQEGNYSISLGIRDVIGNTAFCTKTLTINKQSLAINDVQTILTTDKETYESNEDIIVTVRLHNNGSASVHLVSPHIPVQHFEIRNESGEVVDHNPGWVSPVMTYKDLEPNETLTFTATFSGNYSPGFYYVSGSAYDASSDSQWIKVNGSVEENAGDINGILIGLSLASGLILGAIFMMLYKKMKK